MVAYAMSDQDATDVAAFFKWIGEVDLNGFPPTPDLKK
jgi:nitric oxide reductase subunit C